LKAGTADLDVGHGPLVAVREPGAAIRPVSDDILLCGSLEYQRRERPLLCEVAPGGTARPEPPPVGPSLGDGAGISLPFASPLDRRVARGHADEAAQNLPDMAKIQAGIEVLDQGEDIALGGGLRVPPAPTLVCDDQHLAFVAPVL